MSVHLMVESLSVRLTKNRLLLRTAESCTGGLIASTCTEQPGASAWFDRGWVTYSNSAKTELLNVDPSLLARHGAVSQAVALAMASGAIAKTRQCIGVAVTGIAGPDGASPDKPVGTVWIAWASHDHLSAARYQFSGNRECVRLATVRAALLGLLERLPI